jgi:hypothetical protein
MDMSYFFERGLNMTSWIKLYKLLKAWRSYRSPQAINIVPKQDLIDYNNMSAIIVVRYGFHVRNAIYNDTGTSVFYIDCVRDGTILKITGNGTILRKLIEGSSLSSFLFWKFGIVPLFKKLYTWQIRYDGPLLLRMMTDTTAHSHTFDESYITMQLDTESLIGIRAVQYVGRLIDIYQ